MAKKEIKKEVKKEVAVEKKAAPKKEGVIPKMNEQVLRLGDEVEVKGLPFKVQDLAGLDIVLRRTDIR